MNPSKVLLVDDDQEVLEFLRTLLEVEGYSPVMAGDAGAALQALRGGDVHLVLLDIAMPDVDGLQLCRQIKADPRLAEVAVVVVSARPGQHVEEEARAAGADDFMRKPFDNDELLSLLRQRVGDGPG